MNTWVAIAVGLSCEAALMLGRLLWLRQGELPPHVLGWLSYIVPLFVTYLWLVRDMRNHGARLAQTEMAVVVLAPMIGVPLYLMRTRSAQQRPWALAVFGLVAVLAFVMIRTGVRPHLVD